MLKKAIPERIPERIPEKIPERIPEKIPAKVVLYHYLINKFKPLIKLHPDDLYRPCNMEYYFANCVAYSGDRVVSQPGEITTENILDYEQKYKQPLAFYPSHDKVLTGFNTVNDAPFYANIVDYGFFWSIQYSFFYPYNEEYTILGLLDMGHHVAEIQHVTLHIRKDTETIQEVYLSARQDKDGMWLKGEEIPLNKKDKNRLEVYAAYHNHGLYPQAGTWWRLLGLSNAYTAEGGPLWDPKEVILIDHSTTWNCFSGYLGYPRHTPTPLHQTWFGSEDGISTTFWQRFCCIPI